MSMYQAFNPICASHLAFIYKKNVSLNKIKKEFLK